VNSPLFKNKELMRRAFEKQELKGPELYGQGQAPMQSNLRTTKLLHKAGDTPAPKEQPANQLLRHGHSNNEKSSPKPKQGVHPAQQLNNASHRSSGMNFALSSTIAAGITATCTYPLSAAVSRGIANDMRLPSLADIAVHGMPTTAARAMVQTGLFETISPRIRRNALTAFKQLPGAQAISTQQQRVATEFIALLGTSLIVTLITAPIEKLAMMQNHSGKALFAVMSDVLRHKPQALFSSASSAFISINIAWGVRLYARLKAEGNPKKEEVISERIAGIAAPIKNLLRCINARQLVHHEALALATLGTLQTMASRPINTVVLIAMNIAIGAVMGTKIYHVARNHLTQQSSG
jgi:hypothetical protein